MVQMIALTQNIYKEVLADEEFMKMISKALITEVRVNVVGFSCCFSFFLPLLV